MAQAQPIDVPLLPMNQAAPDKTGGPVGRINRLINAEWRKYEAGNGGMRVRTAKRKGFTEFPRVVRDPLTGGILSKSMASPTVMGTLGNRLLIGAGAAAFLLSESAGCFESPSYHCPTQTLRAQVLPSNGVSFPAGVRTTNQIARPDSARIGTRTLNTWTDSGTGFIWFEIIDDDGTAVAAPNTLGSLATMSKAISDGTRFWVAQWTNIGFRFDVIDTNGVVLATDVGTVLTTTQYYDVIARTDTPGLALAQKWTGGNGIQIHALHYAAGAIFLDFTNILTGGTNVCSTGRLAFLKNDRADHNYYLVGIDGAGPFDYHGWQITDATTVVNHHYAIKVAAADNPIEIAGYVNTTGAADLTVLFGCLDTAVLPGPFTYRNFSLIYTTTFAGATTLARTQRSLTPVSRPFIMNGTYYIVVFYQSDPGAAYTLTQSTYFLLNLAAPWQICGMWDQGTAYADWQSSIGSTIGYMHLSTPTIAANGAIHVTFTYRVRSFTARVINSNGDIQHWTNTPTATLGLRDYSFGPDSGIPFEAQGALFIPGPQCHTFSGNTIAEDGIGIIPELNVPVAGNVGGAMTSGTRSYVVTHEWSDDSGQRVIGPAGPPASATVNTGAGQNGVTVTGTFTHVNNKPGLRISLWRQAIINGITTDLHYKITSDITPLLNDDGSATWTYVDKADDNAIVVNESLYVDKGFLDRFPCPAHRGGVATADRAFVVGWDNAIWVSGPKTEGDAWWFSPALRIPLPTGEQVTKCVLSDTFLVVYCATSNVFTIPIGQLPNATGTDVGLPSALLRPFSNGCNGQAQALSDGIVYASAQGGIWITTRGMDNQYFGEAVKDETELHGPVISMASDKFQRIYMQCGGNNSLVVYDQISKSWYIWNPFDTPTLLTTHKGLLAYATATGHIWRQTNNYFDLDATGTFHAINQVISIAAIHFGGIRNFKRVWNAQFEGEWLAAHNLTVVATYHIDDIDTQPTDTYTFALGTNLTPYVFEMPPTYEECTAIEYVFTESTFVTVDGPVYDAGFALESLGFEVGVEPMLGKLPTARRQQPT